MNRKKLINFIKKKDKFYQWVKFDGFTDNQLMKILIKIKKGSKH